MAARAHHVGERLSLKNQLCTVRYIGSVDLKAGEWLGLEWDDPQRGKHNGTHDGKKYFSCQSTSATCASFIRPNQPWDQPRTFLEALRDKYMSNTNDTHELIYFSTKQAEEVGFDKFARRQAELRGIHVLVLDRMRIRHRANDSEAEAIRDVCAEITDLDVSCNLFENWSEVQDLVGRFPKLRSLATGGNRVAVDASLGNGCFGQIKSLNLSNVLLNWTTELVPLLRDYFDGVDALIATNNEWTSISRGRIPDSVKSLDLSENAFEALADLACLENSAVHTLILKNCNVRAVNSTTLKLKFTSTKELDIRHNKIANWSFFNDLPASFPGLTQLRTTGNPLYASLKSAGGKALTAEDGYMLTIARLPKLETLNYSKVTEKERLNAETYYLNQIAAEVSATSTEAEAADARRRHPRWAELCEEYGEPALVRKAVAVGAVNSNSLAARLVKMTFVSGGLEWIEEVPKTFSMYEVLGIVGKKLGIMPLKLRLLLETDEHDVAQSEEYEGPEWWNSDSEDEGALGTQTARDGLMGPSTVRVVELLAGSRAIGTYIEGQEGRLRVQLKNG